MAKRKVERRARKILGEEPLALVWCEIRPVPAPPKDVHRAAGKGPLKSRHHWLWYVGVVVFCFVIVPIILIDTLGRKFDQLLSGRSRGGQTGQPQSPPDTQRSGRRRSRKGDRGQDPADGVFDGDWDLTAGQLLLRWYGHSPSPKRLVMLTRNRICVAASPRRRLSPTKADDFRTITEFTLDQARIEGEAGQPRGYATFRLVFADGSWLEMGQLGEPEDADHFLRTVSG
ncbi:MULTISPECIES: hypothetical protein [Streptomyces]|uniref:Uncharacterized protein n=2 Tax=Streptomyces TaxID=1883 RepID=A0A8H9I033_9ACTN|nr:MULTISPECIES: hypothetical protein [Streptomyces]MDQ0297459.1 hypothetical protein [Streptomyces sp. DSM 41037]WPR49787.1 hypothetical protein SJI45_00350 [Streptomyces sp. S399]SUP61879.1 Uncharacterised protein [Streptomyces griseus]GFH81489.1 hypothetical protein Sgou_61590 [Streptomyces gougerotii]GGU92253.1 hypothetical protein GCM10010227_54470 [Streptomyces gougerotii]